MQKAKIQIILVSGQMIPNVLAAADSNFKPEKVILCTSSEMNEHAEYLKAFFARRQIASEFFDIGDALNYPELYNRFFELRCKLDSEIQNVAVNLTGGTKLMTLAAMASFHGKENEATLFYVQPERNSFIMLDPNDHQEHKLASVLKIEDFFRIHGYQVSSISRTQPQQNIIDFGTELFAGYDRFRDAISSLNYFATESSHSKSLEFATFNGKSFLYNHNLEELIQMCAKYGFISYYDDKKIVFSDPEAQRICGGTWLEFFVHDALKKAKSSLHLQDCAMSIEILSQNGTKNELDGAFLYNNILYIIECKTSRVDRRENAIDIIYKLDSLKGIPGTFTKPVIISFLPFEPFEAMRASELNIICFTDKMISHLERNLVKRLPLFE